PDVDAARGSLRAPFGVLPLRHQRAELDAKGLQLPLQRSDRHLVGLPAATTCDPPPVLQVSTVPLVHQPSIVRRARRPCLPPAGIRLHRFDCAAATSWIALTTAS